MKTPHTQYWTPILKILERCAIGSAETKKIRADLLKAMGNQFNSDDYENILITGENYEPAWWNQARHAAEQMRKDELLAPSTKRSIWTITEKGKKHLIENKPIDIYNESINLFPDEIEENKLILEGAKHQVTVNAYERDPKARKQCIAHHGTKCCICGFSFRDVYGALVENFIHIHHLKPLSEIRSEYTVNPINDLRPVCPNCHAVLHIRKPALSIEEVKKLLQKS